MILILGWEQEEELAKETGKKSWADPESAVLQKPRKESWLWVNCCSEINYDKVRKQFIELGN